MNYDEPNTTWKSIKQAERENQTQLVPSLEEEESIEIDINQEKYRIVVSRDVSEYEINLKSLIPPDLLKEQLYQDELVGKYFNDILSACQVRKTSGDIVDFMDIITHTLNNIDQVRRFMQEHGNVTEIATVFENFKLSHYLNDWKTKMIKSLSMKDGRVEIHINEVVAAIHMTRNEANRVCQKKTEEAQKVYKAAVAEAVNKRDHVIQQLGPLVQLADLTGSYVSQSDKIKQDSRNVWKQIPDDEKPEDFKEWAQVWWTSEKSSRMSLTIESLKNTPEFQDFFLNHWSFRN